MKDKLWLLFILITIATWGVWGAFSGYQIQNGISDSVVYILWALSMLPCAIVALIINKGKFLHDWKSALLGCTVGLLGAGGQLVLFKALTLGPSYIIFPFISMSPVIVITLAAIFLKEKATKWQIAGIVVALAAILFLSLESPKREFVVPLEQKIEAKEVQKSLDNLIRPTLKDKFNCSLSVTYVEKQGEMHVATNYLMKEEGSEEAVKQAIFEGFKPFLAEDMTYEQFKITQAEEQASSGWLWILLAVMVLFAWGIQGFFMKFANNHMDAESIFVWMALSGLVLIPVAWFMGGDTAAFFTGANALNESLGCFGIQILNSIGALTLVYAYRHGKAVIVSPMEGLSPMVTVLLSLIILSVIPNPLQIAGICCAAFAMYALSK